MATLNQGPEVSRYPFTDDGNIAWAPFHCSARLTSSAQQRTVYVGEIGHGGIGVLKVYIHLCVKYKILRPYCALKNTFQKSIVKPNTLWKWFDCVLEQCNHEQGTTGLQVQIEAKLWCYLRSTRLLCGGGKQGICFASRLQKRSAGLFEYQIIFSPRCFFRETIFKPSCNVGHFLPNNLLLLKMYLKINLSNKWHESLWDLEYFETDRSVT